MRVPLRRALRFVGLSGVVLATTARATVYTVTANEDMTFSPAAITIYQGDTIAFQNTGGTHNVHADNNRFECSINCTTNNTPSDTLWRSTVRFPQLGTFGYYCDAHGDPTSGMRGSVTVIDRVFVDGFDTPAADQPVGR